MAATSERQLDPIGPALLHGFRARQQQWEAELDRALQVPAGPVPFWDRWSMARYLTTTFAGRQRLEDALVDALRPQSDVALLGHLDDRALRLEQLRRALDELGRRRGTTEEMRGAVAHFREAFHDWCDGVAAVLVSVRATHAAPDVLAALGRLGSPLDPA